MATLPSITTLRTSRVRIRMLGALAVLQAGVVQACWQEAADRYHVNAHVLQAIARCESNLNPQAMNRSHQERTGSYDIGLMQINSSNLPGLKAHGIGEEELMDACTNIHVGAWILAQKIQRHGNTWEAVGAYNASCSKLKGVACSAARERYARCVYSRLPAELKGPPAATVQTTAATSPPDRALAQAEPAIAPLIAVRVTQ